MVSSYDDYIIGRSFGRHSPYYMAMGLMYIYNVEPFFFDKPGQVDEIVKVIPYGEPLVYLQNVIQPKLVGCLHPPLPYPLLDTI